MSTNELLDRIDPVAASTGHETPRPELASRGIDLAFVFDFVRRRFWVIVLSVAVVCGLGLAYFITIPAPYTGTAILKIDTRRFQLFQGPTSLGDQAIGAGAPEVESHIEGLKSENLALKVIAQFHLADDPEFGLAAAIPIISNLVERRHPESASWRERNALRIFNRHYRVERQSLYLIAVNFESASATRSAQIANALVETYLTEQLDAQYEVTREGGKWLEGRIGELRGQVASAA